MEEMDKQHKGFSSKFQDSYEVQQTFDEEYNNQNIMNITAN